MKILAPISEDEVIALFLKSSFNSARFSDEATQVLTRLSIPVDVIEVPALTDARQNAARRAAIGEFRGFGQGTDMFTDFPGDVRWYRAGVTWADLSTVLYIDYDYWVELSGGSRRPTDAAERIRQGITVFGVSNDGFWLLADAVKSGAVFPELILVAANADSRLVVIDGHARLTSYALAPEHLPAELPAIVGYSPGMTTWGLY